MAYMGGKPVSPKNFMLLVFSIMIRICFAEEREIYLALMEGNPVAFAAASSGRHNLNSEVSRAHQKRLVDSHDHLLASVLETGSYTKLYSFGHVVNGFSIHATKSQAEKLRETPGVMLVERDRGAKLMTTYTPQFLGLPQGVWRKQGGEKTAGQGIVIGFVDTGINPSHPSFANPDFPTFTDPSGHNNSPNNRIPHFSSACETGPFFPASSCNGKIVSARFFAAGARATAPLNSSVDFLSPYDAVGHGSHVAAIAAGNADVPVVVDGFFYGKASGVAPGARIAVYKAVYPTVGTLTDVIAAIDQAVHDGVDAIALSVGPDEAPEDTPTLLSMFDIAMLGARRAGAFVAQAAGNHGPFPKTVLSFSPWTVGVAASSTDRAYPGSLLLGNGQTVPGVGLSGPTLGGMSRYQLILAKDAVNPNGTFPRTPAYVEECQHPEALEPGSVQGSIVICNFSDGFFNQTSSLLAILDTAKALRFAGFILIANPAFGDFIAEPIPFSVPGLLVPKVADAQIITEYYKKEKEKEKSSSSGGLGGSKCGARAGIGEGRVAGYGRARAPTVSRFSSRGPDFVDAAYKAPLDVLKPDLLAPGHQVWSAWSPMSVFEPILNGYDFALLSGTSMATPHVIGAAAIIKQRNPSWTPSMIASAMSTTATNSDNFGDRIMAEGLDTNSLSPSTPFDVGAGHIDPTAAMDPGLVFSSDYGDYISFLCSVPSIGPSKVKAATGESCTHPFTYPSDLNLPSVTISALTGARTVRRTVKNVDTRQETYVSSVRSPNGTTTTFNPAWFTISSLGVQDIEIEIRAIHAMCNFSFGEIVLTGSLNHIVRIPLSILSD